MDTALRAPPRAAGRSCSSRATPGGCRPPWTARPRTLLEATAPQGLEGIVAKRRDSPYEPGCRGREWLKIKNVQRQEFVIGGWTAGRDGGPTRSARCWSATTATASCTTRAGRHRLLRRRPGDAHQTAAAAGAQTLAVRASELRPQGARSSSPSWWASARSPSGPRQGRLRQPSFVGLRDDKPAADVVREEASE